MKLEEFFIKKTTQDIRLEDFSVEYKALKEEIKELSDKIMSLKEGEEDSPLKDEAKKYMKLANKYFSAVDNIESDVITGKKIIDEIEDEEIFNDEIANERKLEYLKIAKEFAAKAKEKWLELVGKKA